MDTIPKSTRFDVDELRERVNRMTGEVRERFAPVDQWIRTTARERPLLVVAGAAGIGYLLGRLLRRA